MSVDSIEKYWDSFGLKESAPLGLLTDIATTLSYLSSEQRDERKRQKLREALVRRHIENKNSPSSILQSIAARLGKSA